jgi:hypothetical protein
VEAVFAGAVPGVFGALLDLAVAARRDVRKMCAANPLKRLQEAAPDASILLW